MDCKGVVRIDYMFDRNSGGIYITEINTIPGSLAYYLWEYDGVDYRELIDRMIACAEKPIPIRTRPIMHIQAIS